jgi:hypothetical protein
MPYQQSMSYAARSVPALQTARNIFPAPEIFTLDSNALVSIAAQYANKAAK